MGEDIFPGDAILMILHEHFGDELPQFKRPHFSFLILLPQYELFAFHRLEIIEQSFEFLSLVIIGVLTIVGQPIENASEGEDIHF